MKYTKVSADAFKELQLNAGVIVSTFTPATGTIDGIIGATSGGVTFNSSPNYVDFGDDIDNVPSNTWQLKVVTSYDATLSGSFKSVTPTLAQKLAASVTADASTVVGVTELKPVNGFVPSAAFDTIWWVGDYTNVNTDTTTGSGSTAKTTAYAGYIAIKLNHAMNTSGFQIKSTDEEKGEFSFEFHAHYDLDELAKGESEPFEIYIGTPKVSSTTAS